MLQFQPCAFFSLAACHMTCPYAFFFPFRHPFAAFGFSSILNVFFLASVHLHFNFIVYFILFVYFFSFLLFAVIKCSFYLNYMILFNRIHSQILFLTNCNKPTINTRFWLKITIHRTETIKNRWVSKRKRERDNIFYTMLWLHYLMQFY